ncbi:Sterile20-like kinase [Aphelenchoides bicaudatus]|nr:Sterile20-like kinase [Aphelenchoides bicaudatus]
MPIIGRFKNLFRGGQNGSVKRPFPNFIKYDVDPFNEWSVVGSLGDGAFGTVQKVCRISDQQVVAAAKNIVIEEGETIEDLTVEIAILASFPHKNIPQLMDCYFYDNKLCMMLEFCAAGAIDNIMIELGKPLTEPQIAYVSHYVCEALSHLHANFVIHRDLKAGNILLKNDGTVKLADFGVSAKMHNKNERRLSFIGTPYWMSPEVVLCEAIKDQPYDCLADIWSLGITLIELAQMDPPNAQYNPMRVLIKIQKSDPPKLDRPGKWSPFFNDFLDCCLKKNPNDRNTADQLKTHPFIKDATNPRPILELIYEKNADVQEEIIVDEEGSIDGGSVMTGDFESSDDHCSKASPARMETDLDLENRMPVVASSNNSKQLNRKKFAAPLPPQQDLTVSISSKSSEPLKELTIDKHNSPNRAYNISPGKEAIEILDDLCNALDCDESPSSSSSSPRRYHSQTPKLTPDSQIDDQEPSHNIRNVSSEYAKSNGVKEVPLNREAVGDASKKNGVSQLAASFNVRPPNQNSREPTKLQRTTVEVRPVEEPQKVNGSVVNGKAPSIEPPKSHTPEIPQNISPKEQHSRTDSGVDSQEFALVAAPPPEPEVDYNLNADKKAAAAKMPKPEKKVEPAPVRQVADEQLPASLSSSTNSSNNENWKQPKPAHTNSMLNRSLPNRATVTRKTRTYVVDGVQVTSTSLHVLGAQQDYALRKKELQELKRLQRREARDQQLLNERNEFERDTQERKFNEIRNSILKDYEAELEQLCKIQKKKMEELERIQEEERRGLVKNIKTMQEKEYRAFQMEQREEMKRLKYEVDVLPRSQRKDVYKHRRELLEQIQAERDNNFIVSKRNMSEKIMESLQQSHQEKLARLDRQFLNERHDLQRGVESALWDNEYAHMKNRFELRRQQLKDNFAMQRSLMVNRHRLEIERMRRTHQNNEDLLARSLAVARKQLPKTLRAESKTRSTMFKESLQINYPDESPQKRIQRLNEFEKSEQLRLKQKLEEYSLKCQRRLDDQRNINMASENELEEIHQSKHNMILSNENQKLSDFENEFENLATEYERSLPIRKKELETKLRLELDEQERFYHRQGANGVEHLNH